MANTPQLPITDILSPMDNALMLSIDVKDDEGLPLLPLSPRINTIPLPHLVHTSTHVTLVPSATFTPVIAIVETDMVVATVSPSKAPENVPTSPRAVNIPDSPNPKISVALCMLRLLFLPTIALLLASTTVASATSLSCTCGSVPVPAIRLFAATLLFAFIANELHSAESIPNGLRPAEPARPSDGDHEVSGALRALLIGASVILFLVGAVVLAFQER